jgi:hypothetical protein
VATAALRMARTAPVNPADQGIDLPMGPTPPWAISRVLSLIVGLIAAYPLLTTVAKGHIHPGTPVAQLVVSAVVGAVYLLIAGRMV